jgi:Domain of unknown function (DUF397)
MTDLASGPAAAGWRRSRHSGSTGGHCVEVAAAAGGVVRVRDSKDPAGPVLAFTAEQWAGFLRGISGGQFRSRPGDRRLTRITG